MGLRRLLFALVLLLHASDAFVRVPGRNSARLGDYSLHAASAATTLIKKNKIKENAALLEHLKSNPEHSINLFLKDGTRPQGILDPIGFYKTAFGKHDSVSVIPEYNKKVKTGFIAGMPPPEIMGGVLRDAGAKAIVASLVRLVLAVAMSMSPVAVVFSV